MNLLYRNNSEAVRNPAGASSLPARVCRTQSRAVLTLCLLISASCCCCLPARAAESTLNTVSGKIQYPGQRDNYTFELTADTRFYFDALANVSDLQWTLTGPDGVVVPNRPFTSSDAQSVSVPTILLSPGSYVLSVQSVGGTTNSYAFRFVNLAEAKALTPDTAVAGALASANRTDLYKFSAAVGDLFFFDQISKSALPNLWWRLIDPYGNVVFSQAFNDVGTATAPLSLGAAGTYTLLVEGYIGDAVTGSYSFNVVPKGNVPPPTLSGSPMNLGDVISGNLAANTTNFYIFDLPSAARVVMDSQISSPGVNWSLKGPSGLVVHQRGFNQSDGQNNFGPLNLPEGKYQLAVQGSGGSFQFRLLDLAAAVALTPGTPVSAVLSPASATAMYRFPVTGDSSFYFNSLASSGLPNASWRLVSPNGVIVFNAGAGSGQGPLLLNIAGTYTLLIEGYFAESGNGTLLFNVVPVVDGLQALTVGSLVNGTINAPGQEQVYTFNVGAAGGRYYFDSLANNGNLRWSLDGPGYNVVNSRAFNGSDSASIASPVLTLSTGDYQLTISASGNNTGSYQFRFFDLASAEPLSLGTVVTTNLNPANSTLAYKFTLAAPGEIFYQALASSGLPNAQARLVDPFGNLLVNNNIATDTGPISLLAGTYTLLAEGYIGETGSGTYSFSVLPVTDEAQTLTLGDIVSGAVETPGQQQHYTFRLDNPARLYFDALANNSNLRWSLDSATGSIVNNRGFNGSDSVSIANPVIPLAAGGYTLTISGSGDYSGAYQFRLFDLATATPLNLGTVTSSSLNPANSTTAYLFTLNNPSRVFYQAQGTSGLPNASVRLVDPYNNLPISQGLSTHAGPIDLLPGTYTLLMEGYIGDSGSGNFSFNMVLVSDASQALTLGDLVSGTIATPGQRQQYTFNLASLTRVYFDSLVNSSSLVWSLDGLAGNVISRRGFNGSDSVSIGNPVLVLPAGAYTLTVSANGDATGAYQFRLFDLAAAAPLTLGTPINTNLNPANTTLAYKFDLAASAAVFYQSLGVAGLPNATARLMDHYGNFRIANNLSTSTGPLLLPAGAYTLLLEGYVGDGSSGNVSFNMLPVTDGSQPLSLGTLASGNISSAGQRQQYTFSLASHSRLYFDSLVNDANLRWLLEGPLGTVVNHRAFNASDSQNNPNPVLSLPAGDYILTVSGISDKTGPYEFRLLDLATGTAITPGTPVAVSPFPANRTDLYRMNAAAGDKLRFDFQAASGVPNGIWRLIDPYNNVLFSRNLSTSAESNPLTAGGIYTLLIEGYIGDTGTGSYAFNVVPVGNTPPVPYTGAPLSVGSLISGTLASASATTNYVFNLASPARLYFDSLTSVNFNWSLLGPAGLVVNQRGFLSTDSADISDPLLSLPAGDYQLTLTGASGTYEFRILDFNSASAITPGTTVSGTLSPADGTLFYKFAGSAGQRLSLKGVGTSGFSYPPYSRIYSPAGTVFQNVYLNGFLDTFTLPVAGDYTLTVEGRVYDQNLSGNYSFDLAPVTYLTNALTLGSTVNATIATAGQRHFYTISVPSDTMLYFDALREADFSWRLDSTAGTVVDWRGFRNSDSADQGDPALRLPAGNYTFTIAGNSFTVVGDYSFRVLNFTNAAAYTPGNIVNSSLAPANSTVFYTFNGSPGQRLAFHNVSASGFTYPPYCRIYGPTGHLLQNVYLNNYLDTFTLPQSGNYTLTVEGRIYDHNASGNYAFNLVPISYSTNALTLGSTVNATISTVGQRHFYSFTLPSDSTLYFDAMADADFSWRLDAPWGQVVNWRAFRNTDGPDISDPLLRLPAGTYTLTVAGNSFTATGNYAFGLLDVANGTELTPGTPVANILTPASATVFYKFNATAGQMFAFQNILSSGFTYPPYCRVYGPTANLLQGVYVNAYLDTFAVPVAGTYTLAVEGRIYDRNTSGTYSFNLVPITYSTNALALGSTVNGTIATVGQRRYYTFSLPAPATLYFDALADAENSWRLDAPWGAIINWRSFRNTDSQDISDPSLRLPAGTYTLAIAGNNFTTTGNYSFRVLNFSDAVPYTPGTVINAALAPAYGTVLYEFFGLAGERYYFDGQPATGFTYVPYSRIYGPAGNIVMRQNVNQDVDTFGIHQSGTYILTVEGRTYDQSPSGNYAFGLIPNPALPPSLLFQTNAPSGPLALELVQSGGQHQLIVHGAAGQNCTVQFSMDMNPPAVWSIYWTGAIGPDQTQTIPIAVTNKETFFRAQSP